MSKSAGKKPKEKSDKTKADNFVWTEISASMTQLNTRVYAMLETHSIKETGADI